MTDARGDNTADRRANGEQPPLSGFGGAVPAASKLNETLPMPAATSARERETEELDGWSRLSASAQLENLPSERERKKRGRGWMIAGIIIGVGAILAVAAIVIAENLVKDFAQDAVGAAVQASLPSNMTADVDVSIAGDWVLFQFLSGSLDEVTLSSDDATIDGTPFTFSIAASGVPIDLKSPVDGIDATVTLDQSALNALLTLPGNDPDLGLGDGTVSYADSMTVLGFDVGYQMSASLTPLGATVLVTPVDAQVTSSIGNIDIAPIVQYILGSDPVTVCVADRLPAGVEISGITVAPDAVTLELGAEQFILSAAALRARGECPSP